MSDFAATLKRQLDSPSGVAALQAAILTATARRDAKVYAALAAAGSAALPAKRASGVSGGSVAPPRFTDDERDIALFIERSKNKNVVCYKGVYAGTALDRARPVDGFWLDIDPAYMEANRKKGVASNRTELNVLERKMAYGYHAEKALAGFEALAAARTAEGTGPGDVLADGQVHPIAFVALPKRDLFLALVRVPGPDGRAAPGPSEAAIPVVLGLVSGQLCVIERIYVQSTEPKHFFQLPSVEYIDVVGWRVPADGAPLAPAEAITERITNS